MHPKSATIVIVFRGAGPTVRVLVGLSYTGSLGLCYRRNVRSHSLPGCANDVLFHYLVSVQSEHEVPGPARWV